MSTITLELQQGHVEKLKRKAGRLGLSVETYATRALVHLVENEEPAQGFVDSTTLEKHLLASAMENDEAYRRLAK